ncbi:hypothetical protein BRADI_1g47387v3 [Brachypodium distachyon]|uniref:Uncharacterized protein n=1 Tax=Brachypodium distachyon TaxID=15368 RepID=A0A2K2DPZ1_BRADI|nr:hypothetical protein BRADI_1g47387v3 [Brachypodium distachyon]
MAGSAEPAMDEPAGHQGSRPPWRRTVAIQAAICLALYAAFSLGDPQLQPRGGGGAAALGRGGRGGVSFLSVAGGTREPAKQARLLRQMEHIAKAYEVKLVLDVAQFGDDTLWQDGSMYFQTLKIPWYSATSHGQIVDNFLKKVKMPYDQVLEIIGVDTGPLQNAYLSTGGFCGHFHQDNSMLYIRNPRPGYQTNLDGFLLHTLSSLGMESLFINLEGEVVQRSVVHQQGRGFM